MAASVESRVPFLDHKLVEFTAQHSGEILNQGNGREVHSEISGGRSSCRIRSSTGKKMGFPTPWAYWLAGSSLDNIQSTLLEPRTLDRKLFRPESVRRLFDEHRSGHADHGNRIWRLLNLELWFRVCIEGDGAADLVAAAELPRAAADDDCWRFDRFSGRRLYGSGRALRRRRGGRSLGGRVASSVRRVFRRSTFLSARMDCRAHPGLHAGSKGGAAYRDVGRQVVVCSSIAARVGTLQRNAVAHAASSGKQSFLPF